VINKTLGVPIFQVLVMMLAVLAAGYTPGEADQLRRDMAAWRSAGRIEEHRERLIPRMIEHGIPPDFAERVFSQIRGFGEYGFPESHAASFALIAYVTAWLRCHYPAAFLCALLDAQPMGFYSPATLLEDAKRHGVDVLPIVVTASPWNCELLAASVSAAAPSVRLGLRYVKGLARKDGDSIVAAREALGGFDSLATFVRATGLSERTLVSLAEAGALAAFGADRRDALWAARAHARLAKTALPLEPRSSQLSFSALSDAERVAWDFHATGMSPNGHPMESIRDALRGLPTAKEIAVMHDGQTVDYVGMVICRQRPGTASGVTFFTLEDETGFVNLVVWKQVFDEFDLVARTASLLGVSGRLQVAHDVVHLVVQRMWKPDLKEPAEGPTSRDFR
jgi:error-prone DNA polymerase